MADPAVQARDEIIRAADRTLKNWETYDDDGHLWTAAEAVVAAVTPLIRAQAFTEAAEAIDKLVSPQLFGIDREQQRIRDGAYNDAIHAAYRVVRGLGDATENVELTVDRKKEPTE